MYIVKECKNEIKQIFSIGTRNNSNKNTIKVSMAFIIISFILLVTGFHFIKLRSDISTLFYSIAAIYFGFVYAGIGISLLSNYIHNIKGIHSRTKIDILISVLLLVILFFLLIFPAILLKATSKRAKMDLLIEYYSEVIVGISIGLLVGVISSKIIINFTIYIYSLLVEMNFIDTPLITAKVIIFIIFLLLLWIINKVVISVIKVIFKIKEKFSVHARDELKDIMDLLLKQFKLFKYCLILFATFTLKALDFNSAATSYKTLAENNKTNQEIYEMAEKKASDYNSAAMYVDALFYATGLVTLARTVNSVADEQRK